MSAGANECIALVLDNTVLSYLTCKLRPDDLPRVQCVNRQWRDVAKLPQVRLQVFMRRWNVQGIRGKARQPGFLERVSLAQFVWRVEVVKGASLEALAVRHGSSVHAIKRLNNIISHHSLYSRDHIYVPVSSEAEVHGLWVVLHHCHMAKRDLAVLCTRDDFDRLSAPPKPVAPSTAQEEQQVEKLTQLLSRSLRVDHEVVRFYLQDAEGDIKAAMERYEADREWDSTAWGPIRTAPVQAWIDGVHGL